MKDLIVSCLLLVLGGVIAVMDDGDGKSSVIRFV